MKHIFYAIVKVVIDDEKKDSVFSQFRDPTVHEVTEKLEDVLSEIEHPAVSVRILSVAPLIVE